ncbi:hypothetical protein BS50DRAFT_568395 [Corynespora cassiicola Philippines]|uniref:Nudix hydrolase domain-containing protein n=1 Tax=Corynespora cassiicola Philippines TaxID=1448308 RepID=A0A2T2P5D0_CORCC|nr:hypothetical protein BS50DRAFT_568395 [Corynespora cassiicola Philippines]
MAQSNFVARQYTSKEFVESCGAILFDLSDSKMNKVCLLHYLKKDEWFLAKGRRNCGESRKEAAIREVMEETGYRCRLLPVSMPTRAPPMDEPPNYPDQARIYPGLTEPFMCTIRELGSNKGVKMIYWFIAVLDEDAMQEKLHGEADFESEFFPYAQAAEKLTFEQDRQILTQAIALLGETSTNQSLGS